MLNRRAITTVMASLMAAAAALSGASGATAASSTDGKITQTQLTRLDVAMRHSAAGFLTPSDRQFLSTDRRLADAVIDPARTTSSIETHRTGPASVTSLATSCYGTNRYQNYFSTAGVKVWEYHTKASWCGYINGLGIGVISGTPTFSAYFGNVNFLWDVDANEHYRWGGAVNSSQYQTILQGKIHYVGLGKSLYVYPRNDVRLFGSGSTQFYASH